MVMDSILIAASFCVGGTRLAPRSPFGRCLGQLARGHACRLSTYPPRARAGSHTSPVICVERLASLGAGPLPAVTNAHRGSGVRVRFDAFYPQRAAASDRAGAMRCIVLIVRERCAVCCAVEAILNMMFIDVNTMFSPRANFSQFCFRQPSYRPIVHGLVALSEKPS